MCGIAGFIDLQRRRVEAGSQRLALMNRLLAHRGPDGEGQWLDERESVGLMHRRLSIIDLEGGRQPMEDAESGCIIVFNGEIYNYIEIRDALGRDRFRTSSDTEVILRAWLRWGPRCVDHLRGMFAFAIWDPRQDVLFCARDRFGIKPFYTTEIGGVLYFASEAKALLPFLDRCETDESGLQDYLTFQLCLEGKTLFKHIEELQPGHTLTVSSGTVRRARYWEVYYDLDFTHRTAWFEEQLRGQLEESTRLHLRADVPVGAYVSGGIDSGLVAALATGQGQSLVGFTGRFDEGPAYDESPYARSVADHLGMTLHECTITPADFIEHIGRVIYHLDSPAAGPGAFSQYMVSQMAARHRKVVLGGQGGDEIFGGYTRYLVAYFEQCIKAAIDGTTDGRNFVVTYESIIPNLSALRNYKPMLQDFWRDGLFDPMDQRYFRLVNRAPHAGRAVRWEQFGRYSPYDTFLRVFNGENVRKQSYFDLMTHFDFKTLLPALLQVEDRVSMAHGLEARVPMLDHPLVEFAATIPADVKFTNGRLKRTLVDVSRDLLPASVTSRTDKMGFPTPFNDWARGPIRDFLHGIFSSDAARSRTYFDNAQVLSQLEHDGQFGRSLWGLLSLELWQQAFHDRHRPFVADADFPALSFPHATVPADASPDLLSPL
ncbi:MAG: asparagine synthase (glutamine-hydrolyzing) [Gemmatimonadaceae bacterium]|nr:asparagine synthase (glutamine-hydrolyzing) [Gemmatimonadaceae bacterium]